MTAETSRTERTGDTSAVESGLLDELDRLVAAQRTSPSPERAQEILDLRFRAVGELDDSPTTRPHADEPPDATPGLPEVAAADLDATAIARGLHNHGALFVRGLLAAEQVTTLRTDLDDMIAATEVKPGQVGGRGNRPVMESPRTMDHLLAAYRASGLVDAVQDYFGRRPVLLGERVRIRRATGVGRLDWHQDAAFYGGRFDAVNAWVALTPCGEDRDGLEVIPDRVDVIEGFDEDAPLKSFDYGEDVFTPARLDELCASVDVTAPAFQPGDAILFNEMTVHRTHRVDHAVAPRELVVTWFFSPDRFPHRVFPKPWSKLVA